ncbi:hypothetical protein ELY21_01630 [Legionella sp. km535]|uniref:right-handed parallel beta-helix repeat-containing protein n=1 Tax=Legionella sp. km535 TaxID=2498107 RepID=UPI000F8CA7A6|nr:right-handed parallel beta-helix repeat-containing protein [Legionella sp. km535]RUR20245.1 hypothetical protein ELY21_01630 [Legionella sp. km535]
MYTYNSVLSTTYFLVFSFSSSFCLAQHCIPITSIPFLISKPGHYCLVKNFYYSGETHAITINSSHVTLDLNQHKIKLISRNPSNEIYGIYSLNSHDLIIKNGTVSGFMYGVYLADSKGSYTSINSISGNYLIEHLVLTNNLFRGIRVEGANHLVINNTIIHTGGSTVYENAFAMGIEIIGPKARIEHNRIMDTHATGTGESIAISFSNNCKQSVALGNLIFNHYGFFEQRARHRGNSGHSFGIWVGGNPEYPSDVVIQNNRIKNYFYGVVYSSPTKGEVSNNKFFDVDRDLYLNGSVRSTAVPLTM